MVIKNPQYNNSESIKRPQTIADNTDSDTPVFSLELMVNGYCLARVSKDRKAHFADALFKRRQLSWIQLKLGGRHALGCEIIPREALRKPVPKKVPNDVNIIAFRCHDMIPMVGYRDGRIFHIIWIDWVLDLYDHGS